MATIQVEIRTIITDHRGREIMDLNVAEFKVTGDNPRFYAQESVGLVGALAAQTGKAIEAQFGKVE